MCSVVLNSVISCRRRVQTSFAGHTTIVTYPEEGKTAAHLQKIKNFYCGLGYEPEFKDFNIKFLNLDQTAGHACA